MFIVFCIILAVASCFSLLPAGFLTIVVFFAESGSLYPPLFFATFLFISFFTTASFLIYLLAKSTRFGITVKRPFLLAFFVILSLSIFIICNYILSL